MKSSNSVNWKAFHLVKYNWLNCVSNTIKASWLDWFLMELISYQLQDRARHVNTCKCGGKRWVHFTRFSVIESRSEKYFNWTTFKFISKVHWDPSRRYLSGSMLTRLIDIETRRFPYFSAEMITDVESAEARIEIVEWNLL